MNLSHPSTRLLVDLCKQEGLLRNQCAYVLATAWHETGAYRYMREIWGPTGAQTRYEGHKDLGNTVAGDGKKFMGRGFVQITGRRNYTDWGKRLGLDLLKEPQLAERPDIAAKIIVKGMKLGTFTGKKLSDYVTLAKSDFFNARTIINGDKNLTPKGKTISNGRLIAGYAEQFDDLLKAARYGTAAALPEPSLQKAQGSEPAKAPGLLASILSAILRMFSKG